MSDSVVFSDRIEWRTAKRLMEFIFANIAAAPDRPGEIDEFLEWQAFFESAGHWDFQKLPVEPLRWIRETLAPVAYIPDPELVKKSPSYLKMPGYLAEFKDLLNQRIAELESVGDGR